MTVLRSKEYKMKTLMLLNFPVIYTHTPGKDKPIYITCCRIDRKAI